MREYFTNAISFWEPRRVIYNAVLAMIVIVYFAIGYPATKALLSIDFALGLFLLAVIANVAYCAITRFVAMGMFHSSAQN
jgi:hypothetical protein